MWSAIRQSGIRILSGYVVAISESVGVRKTDLEMCQNRQVLTHVPAEAFDSFLHRVNS